MCVCFGNTEKCHQQEIFLADLCLTFMFMDCECVYVYVHVCVCLCLCVCMCCQLLFQAVPGLWHICAVAQGKSFLAADLILLKRICVFVCVCLFERETFSAGSGSGNRERWMRECQLLLCVCVCGTVLEKITQEVWTDNLKMDEWILSTVCSYIVSVCVCVCEYDTSLWAACNIVRFPEVKSC